MIHSPHHKYSPTKVKFPQLWSCQILSISAVSTLLLQVAAAGPGWTRNLSLPEVLTICPAMTEICETTSGF